jgi:hypothetical protein
MADLNFKKDIKLGEKGEMVVLNDLISSGAKLISNNKDNKFDLLVNYYDRNIKYEVKTDVYVSPGYDTGNMFVEYKCRGKDSGITVTEADWFVTYFVHFGEIWYIKTNKLRELINNNNFISGIGGDIDSKSTGYLIPREKFRKLFIIRKCQKSI